MNHVRRGQVGLENLSQLWWGVLKCIYVGNSIWVKGNKLVWRGERKLSTKFFSWSVRSMFGEVSEWRHSFGWHVTKLLPTTSKPPARLSWFFITSTISGIPATNVSFQYPITRSRGYRRTTGTSTKVHHAFSCPYNWPGQCRKNNHPPASLQYNRTAENFQSGGSSGIPCSRHHYLTSLIWIDWLVQAQSNRTGNVDL